ncbi:MAG: hypothetical protein CMJ30_08780 [Phycisphaerae bacterium]|nr:hypothetical protein [Phycisphaerae bacterium]
MPSAADTFGATSHLQQTHPVACQSIGDAGAWGGGHRVFVINEAQPTRQTPARAPSSNDIELVGLWFLRSASA